MRVGAPLEAGISSKLPRPLAVGRGTALLLEGHCLHAGGPAAGLELAIGNRLHPVERHPLPPPDARRSRERWWAMVPFEPVLDEQAVPIALRAKLGNGSVARADLGSLELEPGPGRGDTAAAGNGDSSLIAICMATYNPPLDLFERQIASIRDQTHANWICVISDDGSRPERLADMLEILGPDPRFQLSSGGERRGVYRNFERALALAPAEATWVALADQDDRWYPEKLETLRDHLGSATLVYGDMRVVDSRGAVLSDTYWTYRRNNHTNFASLMLANTVTGAAALFRRELLDRALPFPPLVGNAYHDHWIACVAMASGRITYVDRPLHDYVQHGEAAQGHLSANLLGVRRPRRGRLTRLGERLTKLRERRFRPGGEYLYFEVVCRIALSARVLEMRCGELMTRRKRRVARGLATCDRSLAGAVWMAVRSARPWLGWNETFGIERLLVHGIVWRRVAAWLAGPARVLPVFRDHHPRAEGHES